MNKENKPKGKSKYQLKLQKRRKLAIQLGLPPNSPYPVIWAKLDENLPD